MAEKIQSKKSELPVTPSATSRLQKLNGDAGQSDEPEYSDKQFEADLQKASPKLEVLAAKARKGIKDGTSRTFPA